MNKISEQEDALAADVREYVHFVQRIIGLTVPVRGLDGRAVPGVNEGSELLRAIERSARGSLPNPVEINPMSESEGTAAGFAALFGGQRQRTNAFARSLLGIPDPEPERQEDTPAQDEAPPAFDGGVREPAPGPTDPVADHNQFIAELFRNTPAGGGGQW